MDLALAYTVKAKIEKEGKRLQPWQVQALTHSCRDAKEQFFKDDKIENIPLVIASRGSSLMGGSLRSELTREDVNQVLIEGFLPKVAADVRPVVQTRSGLRTKGLPYAQDAGISRHLAAFLAKQLSAIDNIDAISQPEGASFLHPTAVLLNGGVFKAKILTDRLMSILNTWLVFEKAPKARLLEGADLDLAVARGAAYYGFVRKGKGVRIKGGTAASYYVGIESVMPAVPGMPPEIQLLCIAPFGMEEGTDVTLPDDEFALLLGESVRFRIFRSTVRRDDTAGTRLDYWTDEEIGELGEIEMSLSQDDLSEEDIVSVHLRSVVPVHLRSVVTEIGTLELHADSKRNQHSWKIEFDVRATEDT
jgi:hypothetical protein